MCPAYEARTPAAMKASCELCRKVTTVLVSSEKTAGIRRAMMTRKRPKPNARRIPIGMIVMDKPFRMNESARRMARLLGFRHAM